MPARFALPLALLLAFVSSCSVATQSDGLVERYGVYEADFLASAAPENPYAEIDAQAIIRRPDNSEWVVPLFWDGGTDWKLRLSPDLDGPWSYQIQSNDPGLNGARGGFGCLEARLRGGLTVMPGRPSHFARQNGDPFWFLGDTAWGYFTDNAEDRHNREQAEHFARTRASQGFNVIHSMLMSEQGVGSSGGPPFEDVATQKLNPAYWQAVDQRLKFANEQGLTVGLALAWGQKRHEPYAWNRFPDLDARKRYARYVAARYSAFDVYFLVSGEWNFEVRAREGKQTPDEVFQEFVSIGDAVAEADPHERMIGIHPLTVHGGVREFAATEWMSFGDGLPDKSNSYSLEDMRFASWDIATAGGYLVNGFGTTYFAGFRDPGPFDVDAAKNDDWEEQIGYIPKFFEALEWWNLIPADELLTSATPRGGDREEVVVEGGERRTRLHPPATTYWAMAEPGRTYLIYVRGIRTPATLSLDSHAGEFSVRQFNPRTGEYEDLGTNTAEGWRMTSEFEYTPPDAQDWIILLERK